MNVAMFLLLVSFLFLFLVLLGYPFTIYILSRVIQRNLSKRNITPTVTLIIPCYNENYIIREKIENTLSMDYPRNKLQIVIVDSASTDGTSETLKRVSEKYDIEILKETRRKGKATSMNTALKRATGELVFLTDADALLERDAIKKMVRPFADPTVGAVVAKYKMQSRNPLSKVVSLLFYLFREKVRHYESLIDSASFFTGELLAFRRHLIRAIDEEAVADDQFILLEIRQKGYRCVTEPTSEVVEHIPTGALQTFQHRRRTTYGTLRVSTMFKNLLFRRRYGLFGCYIFPVSIARIILLPFACFFVEISLLYLLLSISTSTIIVFAVVSLCSLVLLFAFRRDTIAVIFSVLILQTAMVLGVVDFLIGNQKHRVWPKLKENRSVAEL